MNDVETNRAIAIRVVEAFGNGDLEVLREFVHEDVDWRVAGIGRMHRDDVLAAAGNVAAGTTSTSMTILTVTAQHDQVVVESDGDMQFANGISYCNSYCFFFRITEGRIVETREYLDTALIERTFGANPLQAIET